jgi:amino acid permease
MTRTPMSIFGWIVCICVLIYVTYKLSAANREEAWLFVTALVAIPIVIAGALWLIDRQRK